MFRRKSKKFSPRFRVAFGAIACAFFSVHATAEQRGGAPAKITCSWSTGSGQFSEALVSERKVCGDMAGAAAKGTKARDEIKKIEKGTRARIATVGSLPVGSSAQAIDQAKGMLTDAQISFGDLSQRSKAEAEKVEKLYGQAAASAEKIKNGKQKILTYVDKFVADERAALDRESLAMRTFANQMVARGEAVPPAAQMKLDSVRNKLLELQEKEKRARALIPMHDAAEKEQSANGKTFHALGKSLRESQEEYRQASKEMAAKKEQLGKVKMESVAGEKDDGRPKSGITARSADEKKLDGLLSEPKNATEKMVTEGRGIGQEKAPLANTTDGTVKQITDTSTAEARQAQMKRAADYERIGGSSGVRAAVVSGSGELSTIEKKMNQVDLASAEGSDQYRKLSNEYQKKVDSLCANAVVCDELNHAGVPMKFNRSQYIESTSMPTYNAAGDVDGRTEGPDRVNISTASELSASSQSKTYEADVIGRYREGTKALDQHVVATALKEQKHAQAVKDDAFVASFNAQNAAATYAEPLGVAMNMEENNAAAATGKVIKANPIASGEVAVTSERKETARDIYGGLGMNRRDESVEAALINSPVGGSLLEVNTTARDMKIDKAQNLMHHTEASAEALEQATFDNKVAQASLVADVAGSAAVAKGAKVISSGQKALAAEGITGFGTSAAKVGDKGYGLAKAIPVAANDNLEPVVVRKAAGLEAAGAQRASKDETVRVIMADIPSAKPAAVVKVPEAKIVSEAAPVAPVRSTKLEEVKITSVDHAPVVANRSVIRATPANDNALAGAVRLDAAPAVKTTAKAKMVPNDGVARVVPVDEVPVAVHSNKWQLAEVVDPRLKDAASRNYVDPKVLTPAELGPYRKVMEPNNETYLGAVATHMERRYDGQLIADSYLYEKNVGAIANRKKITVNPALGLPENHSQVHPLMVHELQHVRNRTNNSPEVYDWKLISFGNNERPSSIPGYREAAIDEVPAYRQTYNAARFQEKQAIKNGDTRLAAESREIAVEGLEDSRVHRQAAAQYLASAQTQLDILKAKPLRQSVSSDPISGATRKTIDSYQGTQRISLKREAVPGGQRFTTLEMDVLDARGVAAPMEIPVPNELFKLPKEEVVVRAKSYVAEAQEKMKLHESLYEQSAARYGGASRGPASSNLGQDLEAAYASGPQAKIKKLTKADSTDSQVSKNIGAESPDELPRIAAGADTSYTQPSASPARTRSRSRAPASKEEVPQMAGETIELTGEAKAREIVKQSERVGKSFEEVGPAVPRNLSLEEAADRRAAWVRRDHSEFKDITPADNRHFIDLKESLDKGERKGFVFTLENAVTKQANDVVVQIKDDVTAMDNLRKSIFLKRIKEDPNLGHLVEAQYHDYKSISFVMKEMNPTIQRQIDEHIARLDNAFADFHEKVKLARGWDQRASGLATDLRTWYHSGVGATFQEAGLAAKRSRELTLKFGEKKTVNFADNVAYFEEVTNGMIKRGDELGQELEFVDGVVDYNPHGRALSEEAIETVRKAKPKGDTAESANEAVREAIQSRFGTKISLEQAEKLRAQVDEINSLTPSLLIEERIEINMGLHDEGVVSFDFKGQNSRNLYQTQMALLRTKGKSMKERFAAIAEGDEIATKALNDMKLAVKNAIAELGEEFTGPLDKLDEIIQFSGDDGIFLPLKELGSAQKKKLVAALNKYKVGQNVRNTYVPKVYEGSRVPIPAGERVKHVVAAELVEKDLLTKFLPGKITRKELNDLQVKVDYSPSLEGNPKIQVQLSTTSGRPVSREAQKVVDEYLDARTTAYSRSQLTFFGSLTYKIPTTKVMLAIPIG